ncbi:MAG: acyl-CoA desaturase [Actinophytocola sp.]|nr:acyl-CoA desaturase [Actinophytocola sp.]
MTLSVAAPAHPRKSTEFAELSRRIKSAGLLDRRHGYYAAKIGFNLLMLGGAAVAFAFIGNSWWQLFIAAFLAVIFGQLAFIGHDAGHKQIFRGKRVNDVIGFMHGGLVGLSYGMWLKQHNSHHANPNHEGKDPDLEIPALAFTSSQASTKQGVLRWMAKYQAFLFFPLLLLEGLSLRINSAKAILRGDVKLRRVEAALLITHIAGYLTVLFLVLSPGIAVLFIVVHQCLWGVYMGCSFAPNHKGMPTMTKADSLDFMRKQILTARNVRGGRVVDFALGGLNYQIEHHLFPTMPRANLRHAQRIVSSFCAERGISYSESGLFRSYGHVLSYLHSLGAPLRAKTA